MFMGSCCASGWHFLSWPEPVGVFSGAPTAADPGIGTFSGIAAAHSSLPTQLQAHGDLSAKLLRLQEVAALSVPALFLSAQAAAALREMRLSFGLQ